VLVILFCVISKLIPTKLQGCGAETICFGSSLVGTCLHSFSIKIVSFHEFFWKYTSSVRRGAEPCKYQLRLRPKVSAPCGSATLKNYTGIHLPYQRTSTNTDTVQWGLGLVVFYTSATSHGFLLFNNKTDIKSICMYVGSNLKILWYLPKILCDVNYLPLGEVSLSIKK
jgi:hypothetical protein